MVNGSTHTYGHTLDLILSLGLSVSDIIIDDLLVADHNPVLFTVFPRCQPKKACAIKRLARSIKPTTYVDFNETFMVSLQNVKIYLLSPHLSVEEAVNSFNSVCLDTLDQVAPLRQVHRKHKSAPWLN